MEVTSAPFAFYASSREELNSRAPLSPAYIYPAQNKVLQIAFIIFAIIVFPVGLYKLGQFVIGILVLRPGLQREASISTDPDWQYQRITLLVNGRYRDALLMGKPETLTNRKWVVVAPGSDAGYETWAQKRDFQEFLTRTESNALIFNYPGIGKSQGPITKSAVVDTCRAAFLFIEERLQATRVIGYGYSMGGGVIAETMAALPPPRESLSRVALLDRTYSKLSKAASTSVGKWAGSLLKFFRWDLRTDEACRQLTIPRIILQTANMGSAQIINDGVIAPSDSLAQELLTSRRDNLKVIGIQETHLAPLRTDTIALITREIH